MGHTEILCRLAHSVLFPVASGNSRSIQDGRFQASGCNFHTTCLQGPAVVTTPGPFFCVKTSSALRHSSVFSFKDVSAHARDFLQCLYNITSLCLHARAKGKSGLQSSRSHVLSVPFWYRSRTFLVLPPSVNGTAIRTCLVLSGQNKEKIMHAVK